MRWVWVRWREPLPPAGTALAVFVAFMIQLTGVSFAQHGATPSREAVLLEVTGAIGPATTEYLRHGFEAASNRSAAIVILRMDTPGGLESSMRDIVRDVLASSIPIVTYVSPSGARAASAGTYILYASHLAAMAPGTHLGAATPVQLGSPSLLPEREGGKGNKENTETPPSNGSTAKAVNDAAAYIRGLADLHRRNADWGERAVRKAASLPAHQALEQRVIEIVAADVKDLLTQADGRVISVGRASVKLETAGLGVVAIEPNWRARFLAAITNPNIAYILMLVGIYGIIFEFASPGTIFPGVIGAICLIVGLFALNLLPISYGGAALVVLGIVLMIVEALAPSFGVLGIGGAVAFALGSLLMFDAEVPAFTLSWPVVLTATGASAALLVITLAAAVRSHRREVITGEPALIGSSGEVLNWSGQEGEIRVHGERWHARASAPLPPGQRVRILRREKLTLLVEPEVERPRQPQGE